MHSTLLINCIFPYAKYVMISTKNLTLKLGCGVTASSFLLLLDVVAAVVVLQVSVLVGVWPTEGLSGLLCVGGS